jgi:membrane-bound lytic murein transglycosylase D
MARYQLASAVIIILFFFPNLNGQFNKDAKNGSPMGKVELNFDENLDSLLYLWYVNKTINADSILELPVHPDDSIHLKYSFSDSLIKERLDNLPSIVDLSYNQIVKNYIDVYTLKRREQVEVMLGLAQYYFPIFDDIFDYHGVPNEMKYMAIIESALNPYAVSRTRAMGLWQFMYGTGRIYGLEINSLVDERKDPIKSTHAAARFAKDLYNIYKDWILVIAAYNCGPGNVNKAIRRSGGKRNYWDIYYYLPRETRGHVPAYVAALYTMNYYKEYGLVPRELELPFPVDTITVHEEVHLKQVANVLNIPLKMLRDLNPQYIRDIVPAKRKPYSITIPLQYTAQFIDHQDSIFAYKDSVYFDKTTLDSKPASHTASTYVPSAPSGNYAKLYYTVKPGDVLGYIAEWYGVGLSRVRRWNNIYRNRIKAGQRLVIYVPKDQEQKYAKVNSMSFAEKQRMIGKTVVNGNSQDNQLNLAESGEYVYHTVRSGDTVWEIAREYPGISEKDILKLNNMKYGDKIKPGQRLKIKPKS